MVRKAHYIQTGTRNIEYRSMKKFNRDSFLSELRQQPWENVYHYEDPNVMWATWKDLLMNVIDRPMHHLGPGESAASDPHGLLMN